MNNFGISRRFILPCIIQLLQSLFLWSVLTYITIYWVDLGFSHFEVGILISILPLTSLVLMVPIGVYVDRISPKKLIMISQVVFALCPAGLIIWHDFWSTVLLLCIGGLGYALFNNALPSLYYKVLGDNSRGLKLGILNSSIMAGYGLGPLIAGFILSHLDMNAVFFFSCAGMLATLVFCAFLPDVPGTAVKLADYRADLSNKSVLVFLMLVFAFSLHAGAEQSSFSLFLNKDVHLGSDMVGLVYFIHANFMAVLAIVNGVIVDRVHGRGRGLAAILYIGLFISASTNVLLFFTFDFGSVLVTRLSHALGDSLSMVTRGLIISNLFLTTRMGGNLGVITAIITFATLAGSIVSGALPGYVYGFVISGIIGIVVIPIAILLKPEF